MSNSETVPVIRVAIAGLLAWLAPGLGHVYIGERRRGIILFVTIALTFWSGVAIGGIRTTVDPEHRPVWFMAELCAGGHALTAWVARGALPQLETGTASSKPFVGNWVSTDIGVHYCGVAGLLNLLIIIDALARADTALPKRRTEVNRAPGGP